MGKLTNILVKSISWIGICSIIIVTIVVTINVIGRGIFDAPLLGVVDITETAMAFLAGFAIFFTTYHQGHVIATMVVKKFPEKFQLIINRAFCIVSAATFGLLGYEIMLIGISDKTATDIISIPLAPIKLSLALGFLLTSITFLVQAIKVKHIEKEA